MTLEYSSDSGQNVDTSSMSTTSSQSDYSDEIDAHLKQLNDYIKPRLSCQQGLEEWKRAIDRASSCCERHIVERQRNGDDQWPLELDVDAVNGCFDLMRMWTSSEFNELAPHAFRFFAAPTDSKFDVVNWVTSKTSTCSRKAFVFAMAMYAAVVPREDIGGNKDFKARVIDTFRCSNGFKRDSEENDDIIVRKLHLPVDVDTNVDIDVFDFESDVKTDDIDEITYDRMEIRYCFGCMRKMLRDVVSACGLFPLFIDDEILSRVNAAVKGERPTPPNLKEISTSLGETSVELQRRIQMGCIVRNVWLYYEAMLFYGALIGQSPEYGKILLRCFPDKLDNETILCEERIHGLINLLMGVVCDNQMIKILLHLSLTSVTHLLRIIINNFSILAPQRKKSLFGVLRVLLSIPELFHVISDYNIPSTVLNFVVQNAESKEIAIPAISFLRDILTAPIVSSLLCLVGNPPDQDGTVIVSQVKIGDLYERAVVHSKGLLILPGIPIMSQLKQSNLFLGILSMITGIDLDSAYFSEYGNGIIEILLDILQLVSLHPDLSHTLISEDVPNLYEDSVLDSNFKGNGAMLFKLFLENDDTDDVITTEILRTVAHCLITPKVLSDDVIAVLKENGYVTLLVTHLTKAINKGDLLIVFNTISSLNTLALHDANILSLLRPLKVPELCMEIIGNLPEKTSLASTPFMSIVITLTRKFLDLVTTNVNGDIERNMRKNAHLLPHMVVDYDENDALKIIYRHLLDQGYTNSAQTLLQESKISTPTNPSNVEFSTIAKDYIKQQHLQCSHCSTILSPQKLSVPHHCQSHSTPFTSSRNLSTRLHARSHYGTNPIFTQHASSYDQSLCYSTCTIRQYIIDSDRQDSQVSSLALDNNGLFAGTSDGCIKLFDLTNDFFQKNAVSLETQSAFLQLGLTSSQLYALNDDGAIMSFPVDDILSATDPMTRPTLSFDGYGAFALNPTGDILSAVALDQRGVDIIDTVSGMTTTSYALNGIAITSPPVFSPCGQLFYCARKLFDTRVGRAIHVFDALSTRNGGMFSSDGLDLVIDGEVWDLRHFGLRKKIDGLNGCYTTCIDNDVFLAFRYDDEDNFEQTQRFAPVCDAYDMNCGLINTMNVTDACLQYSRTVESGYIAGWPVVYPERKKMGLLTRMDKAKILVFEYAENYQSFVDSLDSSSVPSEDDDGAMSFDEFYDNGVVDYPLTATRFPEIVISDDSNEIRFGNGLSRDSTETNGSTINDDEMEEDEEEDGDENIDDSFINDEEDDEEEDDDDDNDNNSMSVEEENFDDSD
ncbi:Uncharacterized protein QTN25_001722 [Entamoeba marina]